jgi:cephalosporin hydroxylase
MDILIRQGGNVIDLDQTVREYWKSRLHSHFNDRYRGRQLIKFPEDLRTYQKVIEETRPNVIIELGTCDGGSAMWFRDQLAVFSDKPVWVVTIDTNRSEMTPYPGVLELVGDLRDQAIIEKVFEIINNDDRVMVVEDSAHTYDVTLSALRLYSRFVTSGCYFVVEDGIVDEPNLTIWPSVYGVQPAIVDFLASVSGQAFTREWREEFGLTMHQGGWLRKEDA